MEYHISDRMKSLKPSTIREFFKYTADPEVISFAAGDPAPESLPLDEIKAIISTMLDKDPMKALLYSQSEGYPPLLEELLSLLERRYNIRASRKELLVVSGAQQGVELVTKVICNEGDTIICEDPSFIGCLNAFRSYGLNLVGVPMEEDGIDISLLEKALCENDNVRFIYLIPNFQNPTGITTSLEKRHAVLALAKKHGVMILEDNPYGDLRFAGEPVESIRALDHGGEQVIYVGSFSKILSSGIRLGYLLAPPTIMEKTVVAKQCSDVHTNMISQLLCYRFLTTYNLDEHIEKLKKVYKEKAELMLGLMDSHFPKEVHHTSPEGGLFVWGRLPEGMDSSKLAMELIQQEKVCIIPGNAFFVDQTRPTGEFRLNFSKPSKAEIEEGIKNMARLLGKLI